MNKNEFRLSILSSLPKDGFSMDELIMETKKLFDEEGMVGFLRVLLELLDALECRKTDGRCCNDNKFEVNRRELKQMHTTVGFLRFNWTRLRCKSCLKTMVPMKQFLRINNYQRKTNELERIVTEVVSEQSYRRTSSHLQSIGSIPVPHTTLHRWVMTSDCDEIILKKRCETLMADGTGYKAHPRSVDTKRPEIKIVIGITKDKKIMPYGAWTETTWLKISNQIRRANHPSSRIKFNPIAKLLVSDGEEKLISSMKKLTEDVQRCTWHLPHDFYPLLKYQEHVSDKEASELTSGLCSIIKFELPKEDFQAVKDEEKLEIEVKTWEAEKKLNDLIRELKIRGYRMASNYIKNAKDRMFSYVKFWLKTGVIHPRVTSQLERMMREIGRRIKKIGHNFSPKGAAKLTNIIIKRITSANEWHQHWTDKLQITGKVKLTFKGCELVS